MAVWIGIVAAVLALAVFWAVKVPKGNRTQVRITPADYGLQAEVVPLVTEDKVCIEGWLLRAPESTKTIVLLHGFGMNKGEVLKRTYFLAHKYNLFYLDCRGAGDSAGHSEAGLREGKDVQAAVTYLKTHHADLARQIALYGISMGSAAAAYYTATYGGISCLLMEGSYFSFKNVAKRWMWKHAKVPYFPLVASMVYWKEHQIGEKVEHFALQHTAEKITCPVLMIQGADDKLAPAKKAQKTYRLLAGPKELWVVQGAGHLSCYKVGGEEYVRRVSGFFEKNL